MDSNNSVQKASTPSKIPILPDDVLRSVFTDVVLEFNSREKPLDGVPIHLGLSTVCQQWRDIIYHTPLLWQTIKVPLIAPPYVPSFLQKSSPTLVDIELLFPYPGPMPPEPILRRLSDVIAKYFVRLKSLRIDGVSFLDCEPVFARWKGRHLTGPHFEELCISIDLPTLNERENGGSDYPFDQLEDSHNEAVPFDGSSMRTLRLQNFALAPLPSFPALKTLDIDHIEGRRVLMQQVFDTFPDLETLVIRRYQMFDSDTSTDHLNITTPTLKTLAVNISEEHWNDNVDCRCALTSLTIPNLEQLEIGVEGYTDHQHFLSILHHLNASTQLKRLRIHSDPLWHFDVQLIQALNRPLELEIIGYTSSITQAWVTLLQCTNLVSLAIDLTSSRPSSFQTFVQMVSANPVTVQFPLRLCCPVPQGADETPANGLGNILGDLFSLQSLPLQPWLLIPPTRSQRALDDEDDYNYNFDYDGDTIVYLMPPQ